MNYLLGVDGGNTKTDYLLCTETGQFVDVYRAGTCSHENFENGFDGMETAMRGQLNVIFKRNGISVSDIISSGFGLAGADMPSQTAALIRRIKNIGFKRFAVSNDGILGVKAMSDGGAGLCVVNGTGTVCIGIDLNNNILQVGGIGELSGDNAGGGYAARNILFRLYSYFYRCFPDSSMFPKIISLLETSPGELFNTFARNEFIRGKYTEILQIADTEALAGDAVAMEVFNELGKTMGHSAAGCIHRLNFDKYGGEDKPIPIVLVGSVWLKIKYGGMKEVFTRTVEEITRKKILLIQLDAPAAIGGIMWAKEIMDGKPDKVMRRSLLQTLTMEKYEEIIK